MKIYLYLFIIFSAAYNLLAQVEYVQSDNKVYNFLERMDNLNIIENYNSFEIPKTRKEISKFLISVKENESLLDNIDKKMLADLLQEFEFEISKSLDHSDKIIDANGYDLFSQRNKYLYYFSDSSASIFINLIGESQFISASKPSIKNSFGGLALIGGEIRGTLINNFGFLISGYNGSAFGDRASSSLSDKLKFNYKFNENQDSTFFDDTFGYLTADFDLVKFKIGSDRLNLGYGPVKTFLGDNSPLFNYVSLKIYYKFFAFSFFHGKLLGQTISDTSFINGSVRQIDEKYIGYHRIGFNISNDLDFGFGEFIIYGDRPIDLSYLNPFNFYKSTEHANRDRDNSMLFLDFNNTSVKGLKFYSTILLDDIDFSKLGTGWWGNQMLLTIGASSSNFYELIPIDVNLEYVRIDPYVFSHRLIRNNFSNYNYSLSSISNPNTSLFYFGLDYRPTYRLSVTTSFTYYIHGANPLNSDGSIRENVGGDIQLGHRLFDSENSKFLDGDLEYGRIFSVKLSYEPIKQIYLILDMNYISENLQSNNKNRLFSTLFRLTTRL